MANIRSEIRPKLAGAMTGKMAVPATHAGGTLYLVYIPLITLEFMFGTLIFKAHHLKLNLRPSPPDMLLRLGRNFFPNRNLIIPLPLGSTRGK